MGTGISAASSTTFTLTTATNTLASGDFALLTVASDNTSTADANSSDHTSVSGGTGTWSKLGEYTNGNGAAAAGVTTSVWLFQATGTVSLGTVITVTLGTARVDKVASMWKYTKAAGTSIRLDPDAATNPINNGIDAANGFGSVAFAGLPSQSRLYYRGLGKEANSTTAITVSGSFTAITGNRSRNNASAILLRGEFRINTSTGETSNPTLAVVGDTAGVFVALEEFTPPAAQSLTQATRFDNSNTFYAPTVTRGTVTLNQGTRYDNTQEFYAATVSQAGGGQSLTQNTRYDNGQTFYGPTVTRGAVTLTAARFDNAQTFFAPTVGRGAVTLTPARYDNGQTFYAATITATRTLTASRYDNTTTFYAPIVSTGALTIAPDRYDNAQTFYGPTVTTVNNLTPARFDNTQAFYSPTVGIVAVQDLQPSLYTNQNQFFGGLTTLYITFPDWVEPGWVEDGWVAWPYFNRNQFFSATVTQGDAPQNDQRGDGVDARWTKKQRKQRDREIEQEKRDREKLRQVIEQIVDPKAPEPVEVVQTAKAVEVVARAADPIVLPEFPTIDLAEVTRLVTQAVQSAQQARQEQQRAAMQAEAQRVAEENMRMRLKRRREEELLLLM
jgi:hypothetical protein